MGRKTLIIQFDSHQKPTQEYLQQGSTWSVLSSHDVGHTCFPLATRPYFNATAVRSPSNLLTTLEDNYFKVYLKHNAG